MNENGTRHVCLPAQRFFWGVLDVSLLGNRSRREQEIRYLLEPLIPVPLEDVHVAYAPLDADRIVGCAMLKSSIQTLDIPDAVALTPADAPDHLEIGKETLSRLNLLSGSCEPSSVRAARRGVATRAVVMMLIASLLIVVGVERRASRTTTQRERAEAVISSLYEQILGAEALQGLQPPQVQLLAERRRLEQTRNADVSQSLELADISRDLQSLLERWPAEAHLKTELITVTPSAITVRAAVPPEEVTPTIASFETWENWKRAQPEVVNQSGSAVLTIRFSRKDGAS